MLLVPGPLRAQFISDEPSNTTSSLLFNSNAGTYNTLAATCGSGMLNPATGDFSLANTPTLPATSSSGVAGYASCGNFMDQPPATPNPAPDAWFRIDPPAAAHRFRITLISGGAAPVLSNTAMAVYEAPSAAGPFRLLECSVGGSSVSGQGAQPTIEATCLTPGNKLFIRIWDQLSRSASGNFRLCIQGQQVSTMADRGADETACTARELMPGVAFVPGTNDVDYVYSCTESPYLDAGAGQQTGGDLWLRVTVPASGMALFSIARGTVAGSSSFNIGVTAYLAGDCADPSTFRQVGQFAQNTPSAPPSSPNLGITCLPPGSTLYLRIHSIQQAQLSTQRFGRIRIRWAEGGATAPPPVNNQPCTATPLAFNTSCPVTTGPGGNFDACFTPGIPEPGCGTTPGPLQDVWFSFVAPPSGTVQIDAATVTGSFPGDPAMALYGTGGHGCHGRFTLIDCDDRMGPGNGARIIRNGLTPGETYFIRAWAEGTVTQGSFSMCITEPVLPAGSCFYLVHLTSESQNGQLFMDVTINGGATTTYSTTPGETNELFLLSAPAGSNIFFEYYNVNNSWSVTRQVYRLGDPTPLWDATSGGAVAGPAPLPEYTTWVNNACQPLAPPYTDCLGVRTICNTGAGTGTIFGTIAENATGNRYDLTTGNMGCLGSEDYGIEWLMIHPVESGTVAFWLDGTSTGSSRDLDFAIWDAGVVVPSPALPQISPDICAPNSLPIRCSSARRYHSTGMIPGNNGITNEGNGGWGWLEPLPVVADHIYLIAVLRNADAVSINNNTNVSYQLRWTMVNNSFGVPSTTMLDCTPLVLPVEYLSIAAIARDPVIDVEWSTATEQNSSHFIVERSTNAEDYSPIGVLPAAGNSINRVDYLFTDPAPMRGVNYYRLVQVDQDGAFEHSPVVVAWLHDRPTQPMLYPNPAAGDAELVVDIPQQGSVLVLITDAVGRTLHGETIGADRGVLRHRLDLTALAAGSYQVQVLTTHGHHIGTARLVKQ